MALIGPVSGASFFVMAARAPLVKVGQMFRLECGRRQVPQTRMGSHLVVMLAPLLDADLRVGAIAESVQRQVLVAELPIE
jgi:hypothetical protein